MDTEKTVEFLLESAARHETQIIAIRNVIEAGMRIVAEHGTKINMLLDAQLRTESQMERLATAQAATEASLKALIDSLKQPRNGDG